MNARIGMLFLLILMGSNGGCGGFGDQRAAEEGAVNRQQKLYLQNQPIPAYDYSLERGRAIELYNARMRAAQTWTVWRGQTGEIEGDCPSSGYPIPYGVQLTSPDVNGYQGSTLSQAEPNGLFTNGITSEATWVFCIVNGGITPMYVETKVTVYPYPVRVDYETNRVTRDGDVAVKLTK